MPTQTNQASTFIKPMLADTCPEDMNPTGYWMSEKLDGVRAVWSGSELLTRNGNRLNAPDWFVAGLPTDTVLDGELWIGRGGFQGLSGRVRAKAGDWSGIKFMVFDLINKAAVEQRQEALLALTLSAHAQVVAQTMCTGATHLAAFEREVLLQGGEGVMLRRAGSAYAHKRSADLLKLKRFLTDEAQVVSYETGTGRNSDRIGALVCRYAGKIFRIGTGLCDELREAPPAIGCLVTFSFFGLTDGGIPRHPAFVTTRDYE